MRESCGPGAVYSTVLVRYYGSNNWNMHTFLNSTTIDWGIPSPIDNNRLRLRTLYLWFTNVTNGVNELDPACLPCACEDLSAAVGQPALSGFAADRG